MRLEVTDSASAADEEFVIAQTRAYNRRFTTRDVRSGCRHALVDTFSFQAPGFYRRVGYEEFGRLAGFSGEHERHYLHKVLDAPAQKP